MTRTRSSLLALAPPLLGLLALLAVRPGVVLNGVRSPVAWAVGVGVLLAGVGTRALAGRLGAGARGSRVVGAVVVLGLLAFVLAPSFRQRTLVEDFPTDLALAGGTAGVAAAPSSAPVSVPSSAPAPVAAAGAPAPSTPGPVAVSPSPSPAQVGTPAAVVAAPAPPRAAPAAPPPSPAAAPAPPASQDPQRLTTGPLEGINHTASGGVSLYELEGRGVVRFEDVNIEGTVEPSVHLVRRGARTPAGGLALGPLKAERGTFSYTLPASVDLSADWAVLVWCDPYDTPIAVADLR